MKHARLLCRLELFGALVGLALLQPAAAFGQVVGAPLAPANAPPSSGAAPVATTSPPLGGLSIAPLTVKGPFDSLIRLEVWERLRGEFVDWFATPNPGSTQNFRYNFIANKLQVGVRLTRDPWEVFAQVQDSSLGDVPAQAIGIGQTYRQNTNAATQNAIFLRQGYAG
jgi:hypothetical protein